MRRILARTALFGAFSLSILAAVAATPVLAGDSPGIPGFIPPPTGGNLIGTAHPGDCVWGELRQGSITGPLIKKSVATVTGRQIDALHYAWQVHDLPPTAPDPTRCTFLVTVVE